MPFGNYKKYPPFGEDQFSTNLKAHCGHISHMEWFNCHIVTRLNDFVQYHNAWMVPQVIVTYDYDTRDNLPDYFSIGLSPDAYIKDWSSKPEWLKDWSVLKNMAHIARIAKSDRKSLIEVGYFMSMCASLRSIIDVLGGRLHKFDRDRAIALADNLDKEIFPMISEISAIYCEDVLKTKPSEVIF